MKTTAVRPLHLDKVPHRYKDKVYYQYLLRTSYREDGKIRHQTVANVSHLPPAALEALQQALHGERLVPVADAVRIRQSRMHGGVAAVLGVIRQTGLDRMLLSYDQPWKRLALAMIVARVLRPGSKLAMTGWGQTTTLPEELRLPGGGQDPDALDAALDALLAHQDAIQRKLAAKHLTAGSLVLYDLSALYLEGRSRTCSLAAFGHNRDSQYNYGVMTTLDGCPVAVEVFPGNTADPLSLGRQLTRLKEDFGLRRVVVMGDREMIATTRLADLERHGYDWITTLKANDIQRLAATGQIPPSLFNEQDLVEITDPDRPGERLVVGRNSLMAAERTRKRAELLTATERELATIQERVTAGRLQGAAAIGMAVGSVLQRWKMKKHFQVAITDTTFTYVRQAAAIAREQALDGIDVMRSNVPPEDLTGPDLVRCYKSLQHVEQAFRHLKRLPLEIQPVFHCLEDRVRAHTFLCLLAYYVVWHLRQRLQPLLTDPDDPASLRGLLDPLSTLQRHTVELAGQTVTVLTEPDDAHRAIFDALQVRVPT